MFFCFPIDEHLDSVQFLAILNKATVNIPVQVLCEHMFLFLWGKYPGLKIWGQRSQIYFKRYCQPVFQNGCFVLHFFNKCIRVLVDLHWEFISFFSVKSQRVNNLGFVSYTSLLQLLKSAIAIGKQPQTIHKHKSVVLFQ